LCLFASLRNLANASEDSTAIQPLRQEKF
jgi:hypothetical protein